MNKVLRVTDTCPETKQTQTVYVTFAEIQAVGMPKPGYKALSYRCEYGSEYGCKTNGEDGTECPLFKLAVQKMR